MRRYSPSGTLRRRWRGARFPAALLLPAALLSPALGGPAMAADGQAPILERIRRDGVLIAGVSQETPPFSMPGPDGAPTGFDIDLVRGLANRLGVDLRLVPLKGGARVAAVKSGHVHLVAATLTHTQSRDDVVDFSITYFRDAQRLLVRSDSGIRGAADLAGRRVGVARGSTSETTLTSHAPDAIAVPFATSREALPALMTGRIDAITSDGAILAGVRALIDDPSRLQVVGEPMSTEPYALALPENDSDWRDEVNAYLIDLWESGRWHELVVRWFGPDSHHALETGFRLDGWPQR